MESRAIKIKSPKNCKISIKVIPGHFATNHSHINYYIDMTSIKHRHAMAYEAAATMAMKYENNTMIDTIVCMDGCEVIAAFLAHYLSKSGIMSMNDKSDISIITPEFNTNGQMIFRDNIQQMIWQKNILLLVASATTGKTINRSLECIKYYGGNVVGISAIFSAITEMGGVHIDTIFTPEDVPNYQTYSFKDCPDCQQKRKIDAIVNSYGYSKI